MLMREHSSTKPSGALDYRSLSNDEFLVPYCGEKNIDSKLGNSIQRDIIYLHDANIIL